MDIQSQEYTPDFIPLSQQLLFTNSLLLQDCWYTVQILTCPVIEFLWPVRCVIFYFMSLQTTSCSFCVFFPSAFSQILWELFGFCWNWRFTWEDLFMGSRIYLSYVPAELQFSWICNFESESLEEKKRGGGGRGQKKKEELRKGERSCGETEDCIPCRTCFSFPF